VLAPEDLARRVVQFDQAALELGNNLSSYTTEPLAKPMLIFGSPHIILYCATSAAHSDFTASLSACVRTARLSSSAWELRVQAGFFASRVIPRTEFHLWNFDLEPTSADLTPGDRIGLEVASSAFPTFRPQSGKRRSFLRATSWDWTRSTQRVYHDTERPAALYLPVSEATGMSNAPVVPHVELVGVTKRYGDGRAVVDRMDLTVLKGEFVSFVGPSGCGKSTVLKRPPGSQLQRAARSVSNGMTPKTREKQFRLFSRRRSASMANSPAKRWSWARTGRHLA